LDDVSKGVFIAERAQSNLYDFDKIGTKLVGSDANENKTVQFLLSELALIQANVFKDYFDMEIDRQIVSGSYVKAGALFQYQAVQNIVIKVTPKNCTSEDYLLVNTHFDSKPATPSAGDAGHMVVSVLEVLLPLFYRLPEANTLEDVGKGVFIAERAQENLYDFAKIGTKVVGSDGNENKTVQFILKELALIKENVLEDYFEMEIDHQLAYGSYVRGGAQYQYQAVQNIVVKITPKGSTSQNYLLVNSHFDSKPTSPSVGDAGHMIVTMMEVIRIITTSTEKLTHSIIFLFNGSEENSLQASDGFLTSHKWAPYCK